MSTSLLECVEIAATPTPIASVIWLHGLGADGHDFASIVPELGLAPDAARFVFPHAPRRPVTINNGYVMRAWYDIRHGDFGRRHDHDGLNESEMALRSLIEREHERGVSYDKIILAGFSQGGAVALQTALRFPKRLCGVLALSTYCPSTADPTWSVAEANRRLPVFMAHGSQDNVIPLPIAQISRQSLEHLGCSIQWREYNMPHSVCPQEIADIAAWLKALI